MSDSGFDPRDLYRAIDAVDSASRSRDSDLNDTIRQTARQLESEIRELQKEVNYVRDRLAELMAEVSNSFQRLQSSVTELRDVTQRGTVDIVHGIEKSEETQRQGLHRVSSGVALVDVLKAASEADQTGIAIGRSLDEIRTRLEQANKAVEEKRSEFDHHFEQIYRGFEKQLRVVGQHIIDLQEKVIETLEELRVDAGSEEITAGEIREAQAELTRHRTRLLKTKWQMVDHERLMEFSSLRANLAGLLTDPTLVRHERPAEKDGTAEELPSFSFPVLAVRAASGEFAPSDDDITVCCLGASAEDCYSRPTPDPRYADLALTIGEACARLQPVATLEVPAKQVAAIKRGLESLQAAGLLREDDAQLIARHLDVHPLHWLNA